jgi:hypothetical protein
MKFRLILSLFALLACSPAAHAELVFNISEEIVSPTQTNLLITASGSVDTDGLTLTSNNPGVDSTLEPGSIRLVLLPSENGGANGYDIPSAFPPFGTNVENYNLAESTEGSVVGFASIVGFNRGHLFLPAGYVSETPLENTLTILNQNFDSFNLVAGESYSTSWAVSTADEDSLTVNIVPESTNFTISPSIVNGQFVISYTSDSGFSYQLEQSGNLNSGSRTNHGSAVVGNDATNSFTINPANATLRYYRVQSHVQE